MIPASTRGLSPLREVLDNRASIIVQPTSAAPAVTISASFLAGAINDPSSRSGLAYLTAKVFDRGTLNRPAEVIDEALEDRGVALKVSASRHTLTITSTCLAEDFNSVLAIVADVARRPTFPESQLGTRLARVVTALRQDEDNPFVRANDGLLVSLYGSDHPYGRPIKGTIQSIEGADRAELEAFHARHVRPAVLSLVIVGDVTPAQAADAVHAEFGGWTGAQALAEVVPPPAAAGARRQRHISMPGKPQSDIAYGLTAVSRLDPRYYAYWMMNNILGEFGLGGRLGDNIRERQGMAYYAFSTLDPALGDAPLIIRAGVDPRHVERTVDAIDAEVRRLGQEGPTRAETEETRQFLIGSIPRMFETNQSIAAFLQMTEYFGLGLDHDRQLPALLESVTHDEIAAAAAEVLQPDRAAVVVAGPDGRVQ